MSVDTLASRPPSLEGATVQRSRRFRNALAAGLIWASVLVAAVPLALVVFYVLRKGLGVVDVAFLTEDIPFESRYTGPGMGPAVVGTLLTTGAAALLSIPLGIMAAVYLNEYGRTNRLAAVIRFLSDVMAGVPSIVMGLFLYTVWVLRFGQSGLAGALALGALMLPIVIRSTESMLRLVPGELREGSLALGASRARTILTVVLPAALPGITSGSLLAVARAAGETAPLLFTIGATNSVNLKLSEGANTSLSVQIFKNAQLPFPGPQERAWGAAFTLIALVLILTVVARLISARLTVR
ncbi:MAG: phosphate ABC transporter permease PstA [Actinomycetota bacterium]|nr:phosphate ABC transporter permease PstA [Actinomycetota bacterium]MDQ3679728.1 phosphate ABC transporter permease PstA [Actinomycetota bacterium]